MPWTEGQKKSPSEFNHPGLWHSHDDLETIRKNVADGVEPWKSAYDAFADDSYSKSSYEMKGPFPVLSRGAVTNISSFASDARAAYQNAIMCKRPQNSPLSFGIYENSHTSRRRIVVTRPYRNELTSSVKGTSPRIRRTGTGRRPS